MALYLLFKNKNTLLFIYIFCLLFKLQMCQIVLTDPVYIYIYKTIIYSFFIGLRQCFPTYGHTSKMSQSKFQVGNKNLVIFTGKSVIINSFFLFFTSFLDVNKEMSHRFNMKTFYRSSTAFFVKNQSFLSYFIFKHKLW